MGIHTMRWMPSSVMCLGNVWELIWYPLWYPPLPLGAVPCLPGL